MTGDAVVPSLVVHGGAGDVPPERRAAHLAGCARAAERGLAVLSAGGSAVDAVEAAVRALEDDPLFNAGTGACLTAEGTVELDASITDGATLRTGAVCALPPFPNPVAVARAVLTDGRHVLLAGDGAARFAVAHGFTPSGPDALVTEAARARLRAYLARDGETRTPGGGTVGAVARDRHGHFAAATSTGGMVGKLPGRVGDSPIVGAGNDADDDAGGVSCTGHGEAILRAGLARRALELLRAGAPAADAAAEALRVFEARYAGSGGLILLDRQGHPAAATNTPFLAWGQATAG